MAASQKQKPPGLKIFENDTEVADNLSAFVSVLANQAIKDRGVFTIGLSGGSLVKFLASGLPKQTTDWSKWRVFFCDERHVPFSDPECTYSLYKDKLMSQVSLSEEHVYPANSDISVEDDAKEYIEKLRSVFGDVSLPRFDILLLGMGPDGHTCSLFPGHPLLQEQSVWVAPISDSPKPPPQRITLTFPVIQNSRCAVFASCGAGKAEMVKRVLEGNESPPLPAAMVNPPEGELYWFLDKPAAALLTSAQL